MDRKNAVTVATFVVFGVAALISASVVGFSYPRPAPGDPPDVAVNKPVGDQKPKDEPPDEGLVPHEEEGVREGSFPARDDETTGAPPQTEPPPREIGLSELRACTKPALADVSDSTSRSLYRALIGDIMVSPGMSPEQSQLVGEVRLLASYARGCSPERMCLIWLDALGGAAKRAREEGIEHVDGMALNDLMEMAEMGARVQAGELAMNELPDWPVAEGDPLDERLRRCLAGRRFEPDSETERKAYLSVASPKALARIDHQKTQHARLVSR
jgi:hypothetical protein